MTQQDPERFLEASRVLVDAEVSRGEFARASRALLRDADDLEHRLRAPDAAENLLNAARAMANEQGLTEIEAEITFRTSLLAGAREDWQAALAAGERAIRLFDRVHRGAATVPVAINNARVALRLDDVDAAVAWGRWAWTRAARLDVELKASAAFELASALARAREVDESLALGAEAAKLFERAFLPENAGIADANAADVARRADDPATAASLLESAAARFARCGSVARQAVALVDVSAIHVAEDAHPLLHRLRQALAGLAAASRRRRHIVREIRAMLEIGALSPGPQFDLWLHDTLASEPPPGPEITAAT